MQRSRRTNPYPFTWEIPALVAGVVLFLLMLGVQLGRSVANLFAGNGWVLVDRADLVSSVAGVVAGHADAGLTGLARPAGPGLLWGCVIGVDLLVLAGCVAAALWGWGRWRPARVHGMATPAQAEALLGVSRLRRHAKVIRPDLYGAPRGTR